MNFLVVISTILLRLFIVDRQYCCCSVFFVEKTQFDIGISLVALYSLTNCPFIAEVCTEDIGPRGGR